MRQPPDFFEKLLESIADTPFGDMVGPSSPVLAPRGKRFSIFVHVKCPSCKTKAKIRTKKQLFCWRCVCGTAQNVQVSD